MSTKYRKKLIYENLIHKDIIVIDSEQENHQETANCSKKIKQHFPVNENAYDGISQIPQVQLTKQDMCQDPIVLMRKLQENYKKYGAVKLKACPEWAPNFNFKYTQKGITTRIQKIHRLKQGKPFDEKTQAYSIKSFMNQALQFQQNYRFKFQRLGKSIQSQYQNQYWQLIKGVTSDNQKIKAKYKVSVEYAADLSVNQYGSGFPVSETPRNSDSNFNYATSHFNLNNLYKSPSSLFKMIDKNGENISGITIPWMYMGMMFSTFCWHVEDLWLNSINYSHTGKTKIWYIIPQSDKKKFDASIIKKTGKSDLLNSITLMLDPLELKNQGIIVYKAYQRPKQYIFTLFNAYHCGFAIGFNVGQAVNLGTVDSLPIVKQALIQRTKRKHLKPPVLCYQWLIANNLGNNAIDQQIIQKYYSQQAEIEYKLLKDCLKTLKIKQIQFINPKTKYDRVSCYACRHYQYNCAIRCSQCEKRYCLSHAHNCCGTGMILLTRYPDSMREKTLLMIKEKIIKEKIK